MTPRRSSATTKNRTEFQLYVDWKIIKQPNVVDFTEFKLMQLASKARDMSIKTKLTELIEDYRASRIAVAWTGTSPSWLNVIKDA